MNETVFTDSNLTANTTYHYRVSAMNEAGLSSPTLEISVKTLDVASNSLPAFTDATRNRLLSDTLWYINQRYVRFLDATDQDTADNLIFTASTQFKVSTKDSIIWTPTDSGSVNLWVVVSDGTDRDSIGWKVHVVDTSSQQGQGISDLGGIFAVDANTVALWRFDSLGAPDTLYDVSGNENHGKISGATWVAGKQGKALSFDGTDSVVVAHTSKLGLATWTVEAWVNLNGTQASTVLTKASEHAAKDQNYNIQVTDQRRLMTAFSDGTYWSQVCETEVPLVNGRWYYLSSVFDGTTLELFIDGVSVQACSHSSAGPVQTDQDVWIGSHQGHLDRFMVGVIDEIRISDKARTKAEIEAAWIRSGGTLPGPQTVNLDSGLVAWYPMNGNFRDSSSTGNHGTIAGGVGSALDRYGNPGQALKFEGTVGYAQSSPGVWESFTITGWYNSEQPISGYPNIFEYGNQNDPKGLHCAIAGTDPAYVSAGKVGQVFLNVQQLGVIEFDPSTRLGAWHHVAVTCDGAGGVVEMWVDGVVAAKTISGFDISDAEDKLTIGRKYVGNASNSQFKGSVDEVRVYNRALTTAEIDSLYREGGLEWKADSSKGEVLLEATTGWKNTGILIDQSVLYRITATGSWSPVSSGGLFTAIGDWHVLDTGSVVDRLRHGSLLAKVGTGAPFYVGSEAAFHGNKTSGGVLYLRMNDADPSDNQGDLVCTVVRDPSPGSQAAPDTTGGTMPARFADIASIVVDASAGWVATGVSIEVGKEYSIASSGSWKYTANAAPLGPEGTRETLNPNQIMDEIGVGCLIGRIGTGQPFQVGRLICFLGTSEHSGILSLASNDGGTTFDNSGSVTAVIGVGQ
jgi:hypothetical protein